MIEIKLVGRISHLSPENMNSMTCALWADKLTLSIGEKEVFNTLLGGGLRTFKTAEELESLLADTIKTTEALETIREYCINNRILGDEVVDETLIEEEITNKAKRLVDILNSSRILFPKEFTLRIVFK